MTRLRLLSISVTSLLVMLLLVACKGVDGLPTVPAANPPGGMADDPQPANLLVVRRIEIIQTLTHPPRVLARIAGEVPNTCTVIDPVSQQRGGNQITVTVPTRRTAQACAEVLQTVEHQIWLDGPFESGEYIVRINGVERRFTV